MKVGILTFHAQINYGGVLQAFALKLALSHMSYDINVIDKWMQEENYPLVGPFKNARLRTRMSILRSATLGTGIASLLLRHRRTQTFIRKHLSLTPYHFYDWEECPEAIKTLNCLVVGSDQVWNCNWNNPLPYLLIGAPKIPAISYAASFGMKSIPEEVKPFYVEGFKKFSAISVREAEGVKLVEDCGATATHVVDPTILLDPKVWQKVATTKQRKRPLLVCYFLSEDIDATLPHLEAFAKKMTCDVRILSNGYLRPLPKTPKKLLKHLQWRWQRWMSSVKIDNAAGPQEFIDLFKQSTWILSDSFHALMFASIFEKQVAILRPKDENRKAMFARIEEFVKTSITGPVIEEDIPSALQQFSSGKTVTFRHDVIKAKRQASLAWLKDALSRV